MTAVIIKNSDFQPAQPSLNALAPAMSPADRAKSDVGRLAKLAPAISKNMAADAARRAERKKLLLSIPKPKRNASQEAELDSIAVSELMQDAGVFGSAPKTNA